MSKLTTTLATLSFLVGPAAYATTIDFTALSYGTAVTNQYADFTASLSGGPYATGAPVTGNGSPVVGLQNSNTITGSGYSSAYPTAYELLISFNEQISSLAFTIDPYGFNGNTWSLTDTSTSAVLQSGMLNSDGASHTYTLTGPLGSGNDTLIFSNGGSTNWVEGLSSISYTVPEPPNFALMISGLGIIGALAWRRSKNN